MKETKNTTSIHTDCKYSFVMAVAKRAKRLRHEAKEKNIPINELATVNTTFIKPLSIALEEFAQNKVGLKIIPFVEESEKNTESGKTPPSQKAVSDSTEAALHKSVASTDTASLNRS